MDSDRHTGIVTQHPQDAQPAPGRAADGGTHVHGVEKAELVEMGFHQIRELEQHLLSLVGLEPAPRAFKRAPRRRHGAIDILGFALSHRR